ncbi:MAG TPA: hypothetical protein PK624_05325 [Spirochaetota bacterium]|nr:hypothetical protein [Spirochaetota bacterium]HOR44198.1 hypothetical protein [Spirochaetota bacterium]
MDRNFDLGMIMKFSEIRERITGINCSVFGISWNPSEAECNIAKRIIRFLEDRRVLYSPSEMEVPNHCVQSIIEIRKFLTTELQSLSNKSKLYDPVKAMRISCRKFLDKMNIEDNRFMDNARSWGHWASWTFASALGELRGNFGIMVAQIATLYGIDVEDDLASIIPEKDN